MPSPQRLESGLSPNRCLLPLSFCAYRRDTTTVAFSKVPITRLTNPLWRCIDAKLEASRPICSPQKEERNVYEQPHFHWRSPIGRT
jgi:hypothetical protein